ncbi:MAG: thioredoxin family protein [Deltaproteobacteria bacterium]|nr:thioredoxin family protein [Deltaproteobacteria bacterium]
MTPLGVMGLFDFFKPAPQVLPERVRSMAQFEAKVLESDVPVIVDVWSATCAPCKKLEPILVDVATRHAGKVRVVEIGTADAERELLAALEVQSTPTLIMYKGGEELGRVSGLRPSSWFDQMIAAEMS